MKLEDKQKNNTVNNTSGLGVGRVHIIIMASHKDKLSACSLREECSQVSFKKDDVFICYPLELFEQFLKLFQVVIDKYFQTACAYDED